MPSCYLNDLWGGLSSNDLWGDLWTCGDKLPQRSSEVLVDKEDYSMPRKSIFDMPFSVVYTALVNKAEKKGRTRAEVDEITCWLTGYFDLNELDGKSYGEFIAGAPAWNARAELITGKICGVQVETIEDPIMKKVRQLDKLVDELAKGKAMEKIKR